MPRFLFLVLLMFSAGLGRPVAAQTDAAAGMPPRPVPFRFVNDQAQMLAPADAKKLESGLRRYADKTGTQVVVVTVPSLGGREVADYGRALGTAWGVGQRDKNNGLVVLLSAQEHKVTIQPGSGLKSTITPAVTSRVINEMTPSFKQGNYFAGLRTGLNTLMLTANPDSNPRKNQAGAVAGSNAAAAGAAASVGASEPVQSNLTEPAQAPAVSNDPIMAPPAPAPVSSGPGIGTLLIGALVVGGGLWFLLRLFRRRSQAAASPNTTPNFLPNRPNGPSGGYGPGQAQGNYGGMPNQGGMSGGMGGGMGMGGMLATGAAAAAGAYLGNRMASGHDTSGSNLTGDGNTHNSDTGTAAGTAAGAGAAGVAGAAGTNAAGDYFASRDAGADSPAPEPDYFSDDSTANNDSSSDYFSSDDNASSSDDSGGGGFDSDNDSDNSGTW